MTLTLKVKGKNIVVEQDGKVLVVKEVVVNGTFDLEIGKEKLTVNGFNPAVTIDVDPRIVDSSK